MPMHTEEASNASTMADLTPVTGEVGRAPAAAGPYSAGVVHEPTGLIFVSGQLPLDPISGEIVEGGIEAQTRQALSNAAVVAEAGGARLADIARVTVYLTDLRDAAAVNAVYGDFFGVARPARSMIGVASLPRSSAIEVEFTAIRASSSAP